MDEILEREKNGSQFLVIYRREWYTRLNTLTVTKTTWMIYKSLGLWGDQAPCSLEREREKQVLRPCVCVYMWTVLVRAATTKKTTGRDMSNLDRECEKQWDLAVFKNAYFLNHSVNCSLGTYHKAGVGPAPARATMTKTHPLPFRV